MKTFYDGTHRLQKKADKLLKLIPLEGSIENPKDNPALERFRVACNLYYEIYNNGGVNGIEGTRKYFGVTEQGIEDWINKGYPVNEWTPKIMSKVERETGIELTWNDLMIGSEIEKEIEKKMAAIVKAAAKEQRI